MIWLVVGIIAVLLLIGIPIYYYNKIIRFENRIDNAWAQIDVQLQRRADLIPNLVETVKGYIKHEKEVLENVTNARTSLMNAESPQDNVNANNQLTGALKTLFAVAENYPDLKANENFLQLQDEVSHTENKISYSRQRYNDSVLRYNNAIETFPGRTIAHLMGKKEKNMLEISAEAHIKPQISF